MEGLIQRDHNVNDPFDRIAKLEARVRDLERALANTIKVVSAGTAGATEQGYYEVTDSDGNGGFVRIHASE